jgi:hypothetical protein
VVPAELFKRRIEQRTKERDEAMAEAEAMEKQIKELEAEGKTSNKTPVAAPSSNKTTGAAPSSSKSKPKPKRRRKLSPLIIPELIARIGNRWTLAANKSLVANIMRRIVVAHNVDHLGVGWPIWSVNSSRIRRRMIPR